jgi:hypothetical protein
MTDPQADYLDELAASLRMANARIDRLERDRLDALLGVGTPGRSGIDLSAGEPVPGGGPFAPTALIQAGAVMAESVVVGLRSGAGSLVVNGGFEDGAQFAYGAAGAVPGWENGDVAPGSGVVSTDTRIAAGAPHSGVQHIQVQRTAGANRVVGTMLFPVMPGRKIYISGWYWCDSGPTTAGVAIEWYTAAGVHTATDGNFPAVAADSTYRQSSGTFVVPTTAAYARVVVGTFGSNGAVVYDDVVAYYTDDRIENGPATTIIDENGIAVLDGAISVEDSYGVAGSVTGKGFGGSWLRFIMWRLYNSNFKYGQSTDIAASIVGTASTTADYDASITSALPHWVVSASPSSLTVATDAAAPSGRSLQSVGSSTDKVFQDAPVIPGKHYSLLVTAKGSGAGANLGLRLSYRDVDHAIIGSEAVANLLPSATPLGTTYAVYSTGTFAAGLAEAPANAAYIRVTVEMSHSGSTTVNVADISLAFDDFGYGDANIPVSNVTLTTSNQDVSGSLSIVVAAPSTIEVFGTFDFDCTVASTASAFGVLSVTPPGGSATDRPELAVYSTGGGTGRLTVLRRWTIDADPGTTVLILKARKSTVSGTWVCRAADGHNILAYTVQPR